MIKVALIEDSRICRGKVRIILHDSQKVELIHCLESCETMIETFTERSPDVVLMDIGLPGMSGIQGLRLLKNKWPGIFVLMLTVFEDEDVIFNSFQAGADGFLLKSNAVGLEKSIEQVVAGDAPLSPLIAKKTLQLFRQQGAYSRQLEDANLTKREEEILQYLMKGQSYKQIAYTLHIQVDTLNSHIKNIYRKLDLHSKSEIPVRFGMFRRY